ncbi:uncharacterized protein [Diadema antillarum]|uniref:uncharacterized protein n=1 Tax=Diadema antillarum TaxID=105358 RepID=UPI003A862349
MLILHWTLTVVSVYLLRTINDSQTASPGSLLWRPTVHTTRRGSPLDKMDAKLELPVHRSHQRRRLSYPVDSLFRLRNHAPVSLSHSTLDTIRQLGIDRQSQRQKRNQRGKRGGRRLRRKIPTVIGHRMTSTDSGSELPQRNRTNLICVPLVSAQSVRTLPEFPTFLLANSRSLNNKFDEFSAYVRTYDIDVTAVTETWFRSDLPDDYITLENYDVFVKSRSHRRGGGVALYAKQSLNSQPVSDIIVPDELEVVWLKVCPERLPRSVSIIVVAAIYHPPNAPTADSLIDHLLESMDLISSKHPNAGFILLGDFNELDITPLTASNGFAQVVDKPTRGHQTLDKIVSNINQFYVTPSILPPLGASDHATVMWSPREFTPKPNRVHIRTTRPMPVSAMREFGQKLSDCDWFHVHDATDVDAKCETFYSTLLPLIDTYFPTRTTRTHDNDKPWITPKIKSLIKQRQRAFAAVIEGLRQGDFAGKAGQINESFIDVAKDIDKLDLTSLPSFLPTAQPIPLVQPWEVHRELRSINPRKASGPDGIPAKIITEFAYELSNPLTHLINASFNETTVPKQWKRAIIVPIPKKPKPSIEDLRPVSLTDHFSKIAEKFITRWLTSSISSSIDPSQFGNRKGHATAHYLIDILNTIFRNADKPKTVSTLVAVDFSKAFDRINHNIAISKMLEMNAPPAVVAWICSFLSSREQCVRYMSTYSDWLEVSAGAPQGTLLGPVIFLCMINDACRDSAHPSWKYVDDLSLLECRKVNETSTLQNTIADVISWLSNWVKA